MKLANKGTHAAIRLRWRRATPELGWSEFYVFAGGAWRGCVGALGALAEGREAGASRAMLSQAEPGNEVSSLRCLAVHHGEAAPLPALVCKIA